MSESSTSEEALRERVDQLEASVVDLRRTVLELRHEVRALRGDRVRRDPSEAAAQSEEQMDVSGAAESSAAPSRPESSFRRRLDALLDLSSEDWLSRIGIALVLFGVLFLFRYTVEQGWLVPSVRVGFGGALGVGLFVAGLRTAGTRRRLAPLLLGGSVATFYATVFAAFQLYALLPYPLAFASMIAITVTAFALAVRQDEALLAVTGAAGGLGTPFLLYADAGSVAGLVAYTCIVLGGSMAVYLFRGWRSLLWTAVAGGWTVLLLACLDSGLSFGADPAARWEQGAIQAGLGVAWGLLGGVPVLRAWLRTLDPTRWPTPSLPALAARSTWLRRLVEERPPYALVNASPLLALGGSRLIWDASDVVWGGVGCGLAVVYAVGFVWLRRSGRPEALQRYAPAHALAAAVLAAYGLTQAVDGPTLLVSLAVEAVALLWVARRLDATVLRRTGHVLAAFLGLWLAVRLETPEPSALRLVSLDALGELVVLGLAVAASLIVTTGWGRDLYRLGALVGWLAWWWNELLPLTNGQAYVSVAWGVTAVALLVAGTGARERRVQVVALLTLGLFVGKLFLVDLATLPALWRILLFLGAGGLFLVLSYSLPGLVPADSDARGGAEPTP